MPRARVVILLSGSGTLAQALLDAAAAPDYPADVVAVGADRQCPGVDRAQAVGIPTFVVPPSAHDGRDAWDEALTRACAEHQPDWVVSAGFMRILGATFLAAFPQRVINTHPALLPAFPGAHGVRDALAYGVKLTGTTVHLVDAGVDTGPVLAQAAVEVRDDDDEATLHERIKTYERDLLVDVVARLARHGVTVNDRRTSIS